MRVGLHLLFAAIAIASNAFAEDADYRSLRIGGEGGMHLQSYTLTGTGYSSSLNTTTGVFYGFKASYQDESDSYYSFVLKMRMSATTFGGLTGLSPDSVVLKNNSYQFIVFGKLLERLESEFLKEIRIGLGYAYLRRSVTITTPNAAFTPQTQHGLTLNAAYAIPFDENTVIDTNLQVFLPWAFSEDSNYTGFHTSTLAYEIGGDIIHSLTPSIDVSAGVYFRQDRNGFSGTGSRGTTDGAEALTSISVPLNVTFKF